MFKPLSPHGPAISSFYILHLLKWLMFLVNSNSNILLWWRLQLSLLWVKLLVIRASTLYICPLLCLCCRFCGVSLRSETRTFFLWVSVTRFESKMSVDIKLYSTFSHFSSTKCWRGATETASLENSSYCFNFFRFNRFVFIYFFVSLHYVATLSLLLSCKVFEPLRLLPQTSAVCHLFEMLPFIYIKI